MKKVKGNLTYLAQVIFMTWLLLLLACNQKPESSHTEKRWHQKDVITEKLKWFLNADHYTDTNYQEQFEAYYSDCIKNNVLDTALYTLLVYGEMIDQNFIYDTLWLNAAKNHLQNYESVSSFDGELVKLYYYIAAQYHLNNEMKIAENWCNRAIQHPDILPRTKIKCIGELAQIYIETKQTDKALQMQQQRLDFYQKEKDTINVGVAYCNIAIIYDNLNAPKMATEYILKAINCARQKNDTNTLIVFLSNYFIYKKNQSDNFIYTPKIKKEIQELNAICDAYSKLGPYNDWVRLDINFSLFYKEKKLDSMKLVIEKMEPIIKLLDSESITNKLLFIKARYNEEAGILNTNEEELKNLASYYIKNEIWLEARIVHIMLYKLYKRRGNFESALACYEQLYDIENTITKENAEGQIYELGLKYETSKKDQQIQIQNDSLKIKQRNISLLVALTVILVLFITILYYYNKQKVLNLKRENESQFTQKLMENTEEERMRIAKDLHDSVGHELLNVKNSIQNKLQGNEDKIDLILEEVREISRNLFPAMFDEIGLKISIEQLAATIYKTDKLYVDTEIEYIDGTLEPKAELNIYRIIQEALSNTRKYAEAESAKIMIKQFNKTLTVTIKDNGKGFDVLDVLKSGKAFGLLSINQRCKLLKTEASFDSNSYGTTISFEIKLNHV